MFKVNNDDKSIYITRGDSMFLSVTAVKDGAEYEFQAGDVLRFRVFGKKDCENVVLQKDFPAMPNTTAVDMIFDSSDTRIGEPINKPTDYWYEIELNPHLAPCTIVGYDENGPKIFRLFPEGRDSDME